MTEYKRLKGKAWLEFGKNLLPKKNSDGRLEKQKEFLQACRSGKEGFLEYMSENLLSDKDNVINGEHVAFEHKFTEREFISPPKDTQQAIWDAFQAVPDEMMASCDFWGYTIIDMIERDIVKPEHLAAELNGQTKTGSYVIDAALKDNEELVDGCVRRILRSMCNPAPRGKRVVFNDFYLGQSYWRWHWAREMSGFIELKLKKILEILDEKYYGAIAAKRHSSKSYISSKNIFAGLVLYLHANQREKITGKQLEKIIDKISYLSVWKAIEMQPPSLNQKEIQEIAAIYKQERPATL